MEAIFNKLFSLIEKLPLGFQALSLLILSLLIISYQLFSNKKIQRSLVLKIQKNLGYLTKDDLLIHPFFIKKDMFSSAINLMRFKSKHKTKIFKIILSSKLECDLKIVKEFIEKNKFNSLSHHVLASLMIQLVNKMILSYEAMILERLKRRYDNKKGDLLFDLIMNKPDGFRQKRVDRQNRIIYQIDESIRNSQVFDNNIERVDHFLNELLYALKTSIFQAEKDFKDMNGEIDSIITAND